MTRNPYLSQLLRCIQGACVVFACYVNAGHAQTLFPVQTNDLIAGQNSVAGQVTCGFLNGSLTDGRCDLQTTQGWCANLVHLYVGAAQPASMAPGQFPYQSKPNGCVTTWSVPFRYSLVACAGTNLILALHAEVSQGSRQETAWGRGSPTGQNWSMTSQLTCSLPPT